jgi:hypothetical protein
MIGITQMNGTRAAVVPLGDGVSGIKMLPSSQGGSSIHVITMYEYGGGNQAALSLQPQGMQSYWSAGQSTAGIMYPILLGANPGQFILTDEGQGQISIQNVATPPPGPFIHAYDSGTNVLTWGHDAPLIQGVFNIEVLG